MTHSKRERLKGFLRYKSSHASNGPATRMPVAPEDDTLSTASASQNSPSSIPARPPYCLPEQSEATGSICSVTPDLVSSPPAALPLPSPPTTVSRPQARQSLWDRAYEGLRADEVELLDSYEKLLSKELPESNVSTNSSHNTPGQVESLNLLENRIDSDPRMRQDQLKRITDQGMERADGNRTKYTIFGHEFVVKDQISQVALFIKAIKGVVDEAVKVSPEASLAWAGVCVLLPVFTNPSAAEEANSDGLSYVISRIRYYVELEPLLWPENLESEDLKGEFEGHIVDLYREILKFQIKTVLRFYRRWLANLSRDVIGSDDWKGMVSKIKELELAVQRESNTVNTISSRKRLGDIHDAAKQQDNKLQSLLSVAREQLLVSKEQLAENKRMNQILEDRPIDLHVVYEACYDSADVQDSPKCDGDTRIRILDNINRWAEEDSEETLLWLVGPAGTGKSTILRTVADYLARNSRLVAGYFFKRGQQGRNDTSRFFTTLAVQMTTCGVIPSFKRCLVKHLDGLNKDAVEKKALEFQFDKLFRLPLADLPPADTEQLPMVIVIDALDECERPEHLSEILRLLSELRNITRVRLRVILTSRSAPNISDAFDPLLENKTARRLEIHREYFEDTKKDIQIFLEAKFENIRKKCRVQQTPWPSAGEMHRLVQLSTSPEPLFIYAATLCRFIYDGKKTRNPKKQLAGWLEKSEESKSQLDQIYNPILAQIFAGNSKAESDQQLQFIGALVLVANPLSALSHAALLAIDADDITWWLPELHAVLDIPSESHKPLRLLHKSFSDFLLHSDGSNSTPYRVDIAETHSLLAEKCVQRMQAGLKQNICDVLELDASPAEIGNAKIKRCIPEDLEYACLHWPYHLQGSGQPPGTYVHIFLHDHFLHWLEALSLLGRLSDGALAIIGVLKLIKHFPDTPLDFVDLLKDARRVISSFGSLIERAPLQTYGALLSFAPVASKVRQTFWNQRMPRLDPIQGVKLDWDAYLQTLEGPGRYSAAFEIAFSPDSQVIASGSHGRTVQLWSATTGAPLQTLEGHDASIYVLVFFDDKTLASGSRDKTVRIWNMPTGKLLHTLSGHLGYITAVTFLPDGERLASVSRSPQGEMSIRLWNLKTGESPKELFQSYKNAFQRVAFSPDSQLMALGLLYDNTIEIWNFPTGPRRCMLRGHLDMITTMVFSFNNQLLASGSIDKTVRLWNLEDGAQIYALEDHHERLDAIAFSLDARLLASSCGEEGIRIWDVASGTQQGIYSGHQGLVTTIAFSPDSQLLASGSHDNTIKLWDTEIHTYSQPIDRHSDEINTLAFSSDGRLLATGSRDRTVRLWDVSTGLCLRVFSDHDYSVDSVYFSPDGKLLASYGISVRVWNVENGTLQQEVDTQTGSFTAVDYSPDGQLAASASGNLYIVTIYNAETGRDLFILEGHSAYISKIVFSPDSQFLASMSQDGTIRLWETNTGVIRHVLRDVNDVFGKLVFSPDSQFLAAEQYDTVVLWNVMSGAKQQTLKAEGRTISVITLSPNNQHLAMQTGDDLDNQKPIHLCDMTTNSAWHTLQILNGDASDILFSPDSQIVAVATQYRTVWLWNAITHRHHLTIEHPDRFDAKLRFSPDGQTLAIASGGVIRLWNTTTGFQLQMIRCDTDFVRDIQFLPEGLVVLEPGLPIGLLWHLDWIPKTLIAHKFSLIAAPQIGMSELNIPEIGFDRHGEWIMRGSKKLIYVPPEYRPVVWDRRGSTMFIGCASGRLLRVQDT